MDTVLTPETFRHRLSEMSIVVATSMSGEVVGTIAYKVLEGGEGHLRGMAVHPAWHGTGLSNSLLLTAENELRKAGCKLITLDTVLPGFADLPIQRLPDLTPAAWVAQRS